MLIYYKLSGVNAVVALIFNLVILLGLMAYIGAVMTLPGIAGFVLTMGIGVDSNVLIFERIKEELEAQHGVRAAINAGFSRVFLTLLDTHISALIARAVPDPVRDRPDPRLRVHAHHRTCLQPVHVDLRVEDAVRAGAGPAAAGRHAFDLDETMHIFTNPNYNFLRWRWHAVALSWVIILAGVCAASTRKGCRRASSSPAARR